MRRVLLAGLLVVLVSACGAAQTNPPTSPAQPAGQSQPASPAQPAAQPQGAAGGGGASIVAAATKVKDVCTLLPADLLQRVAPGAPKPESQLFPPLTCTVFNGSVELQVTLGAYDTGGPVAGAEVLPGLAAGGYFVRPNANDVYLTVLLSQDSGELYVEIVDPAGKDGKDDAIAVAQQVLGALH